MNKLFKSGASAAIAAIAAVALMTGNIAFAVPGDDPNGRPFQEEPAAETSVGISHHSVGGTVPAASNGLPGSLEIKAYCQQDGHLAVGGGYTAGGYKGGVTTYQNRNTTEAVGDANYGKGWLVGFTNHNSTAQTVRAWVVCAEAHEDEL